MMLLKKIRGHFPVSRKQHGKLLASLEAQFARLNAQLTHVAAVAAHANARIAAPDYLLALPNLATGSPVTAKLPVRVETAEEVCLFVSFAPEPELKSHVYEHLDALLGQGVAVVLIVNTPHAAERITLASDLVSRLSGCLIRANEGFDFAAWAHAFSLATFSTSCRRLYLINDSIVGPLRQDDYAKMLARIRASDADLIGLTENSQPQPHLQSYFLVAGRRLLHSATLRRFLHGIVNMPDKDAVIAQYETQLTRFLRAQGFKCEALFSDGAADDFLSNRTVYGWARLIESGFPFIKAQVLAAARATPEAAHWIPPRYLTSTQ